MIVWKLAEEIRIEVFGFTGKPDFAADLRARSQADDAAKPTCRNIAEGFGCETHAEFASYLEISRRSLNELQDILHGAWLKKYVTTADWPQSGDFHAAFIPHSAGSSRISNGPPMFDRGEAPPNPNLNPAKIEDDRTDNRRRSHR